MKNRYFLIFSLIFLLIITSCGGNSSGNNGSTNVKGTSSVTLSDVTNLTVTVSEKGGELVLTWKMPDDKAVTGVVIVRKTGSESKDINDGKKVFEGDKTTYTDNGLTNGTKYFYLVVTTDGKGDYSKGVVASGTPKDTLAPSDVSDLTVEQLPDGSIKLSWSNPSDEDFKGVKIVKKEGTAPTSTGDGEEIYKGSGKTYTDNDTVNNKRYYYLIVTYDENGNYSKGIIISEKSVDQTASGEVSNINVSAVPEGNALTVYWTEPSDKDYNGVTVLRGLNGYCPSSTSDTYAGVVTVGNYGKGTTTFEDSGLVDGIEYCYSFFTYDEVPNYSSGSSAKGTPADSVAPANIYALSVTVAPEGNKLTITWHEPSDSDYMGVRILRGLTGYCANDPNDTGATIVGTVNKGTSYFQQVGLVDDIKYCYTFFSFDEATNYSDGATITATPHDSVPPSPVTVVKVLPSLYGNQVIWEAPSNTDDIVGYRIISKEVFAPTGPNDGTLIPGTPEDLGNGWYRVVDSNASKDVVTHYAIFSYDEVPNYASSPDSMAGLNLQLETKMGVSGMMNKMVILHGEYYVVYATDGDRGGINIINVNSGDITNIVDEPVSEFTAFTDDQNEKVYIIYTSLYGLQDKHPFNGVDKNGPGIKFAAWSPDGYSARNVILLKKDRPNLQLYAVSGLYDGDNVRAYISVDNQDGTFYIGEALLNKTSGTVMAWNNVGTITSNSHLFSLKAKWNNFDKRAELLAYFLDLDGGQSELYLYKEEYGWTGKRIYSSENNGGRPISPPAFAIDSNGNNYIYYKKNVTPSTETIFRGHLEIRNSSGVIISKRDFGTEIGPMGLNINESDIVMNSSNEWAILTYTNSNASCEGEIDEIFINSSSVPVTVSVAPYPTLRTDDFPCIGRRQVSGIVDESNHLALSAWNVGLYSYNGDFRSTGVTFVSNSLSQDQDFHWPLVPIEDLGGIDLINIHDNWYFISSGYHNGESGKKGIMSPFEPASNNLISFDSGYIFDSDYSSSNIVAISGNFKLWVSKNNGVNWSSHDIDNSIIPKRAAIKISGYNVYIAVFDTANNLHYCHGDITLYSFTCSQINEDTVPITDWIDINSGSNLLGPAIQYVFQKGSAYGVRVLTPDLSLNNIIATGADINGNRLMQINNSLGSIIFKGNQLFFTDNVKTTDAYHLEPCSFSQDPIAANNSVSPQISADGKMVFYLGDPSNLYYGVYLSGLNCWVFDIPIAYHALSNDTITILDTLFLREEDTSYDIYRIGFPSFPTLRNMGANSVLDITLTYK